MREISREEFLLLRIKCEYEEDQIPISRTETINFPFCLYDMTVSGPVIFTLDLSSANAYYHTHISINAYVHSCELLIHNDRYYLRVNNRLIWIYFIEQDKFDSVMNQLDDCLTKAEKHVRENPM